MHRVSEFAGLGYYAEIPGAVLVWYPGVAPAFGQSGRNGNLTR
ncbi:MAG TPA: hypothetical protein VKR52_20405 [Terracidiphilus sp.]|nr:hypothetical protein [Terracidiphilus sp.]